MRAGRPHGLMIALGVTVGSLLAITVVSLGAAGPRVGGPLARGGAYRDGIPLPFEEVATWGFVIPDNLTVSEIVVLAVEPVDPVGVEVLGVLAHHPDTEGAVGQHYGFPPSGVEAFAPGGAVLPPAGTPLAHLEVLVGVRLTDRSHGSIDAVRVRYRHNGIEYADTLPYSLWVFVPTA